MKRPIRQILIAASIATLGWTAAAIPPAAAVVGSSADGAALSPYVVMVLNRAGAAAGFCSGIVLAQDVVMTAAHCVPAGADLRVHFRDEEGAPVLLPVAAVARHPGYRADAVRSRERSIDLALIRLQAPLPARFRPATLLAIPPSGAIGSRYRLAGFGVTREGDGASSGHLRIGTLEVREPLSQVLLWARDPGGRGAGACTGDSGGPVFEAATDNVAALTLWSAGNGSARCGALTQALWLSPQRAWIADVLGRWNKRS